MSLKRDLVIAARELAAKPAEEKAKMMLGPSGLSKLVSVINLIPAESLFKARDLPDVGISDLTVTTYIYSLARAGYLSRGGRHEWFRPSPIPAGLTLYALLKPFKPEVVSVLEPKRPVQRVPQLPSREPMGFWSKLEADGLQFTIPKLRD